MPDRARLVVRSLFESRYSILSEQNGRAGTEKFMIQGGENRILTLVIFFLFIPTILFAQSDSSEEAESELQIDVSKDEILADFEKVWETINEKYVDSGFGNVDWESLRGEYRNKVEDAEGPQQAYELIGEMIGKLQNPTTYIEPPWLRTPDDDEADRPESEDVELEYAGVGILLQQMQSGEVWVLQVFKDTPAENGGVLVGDVIAGVNDWEVQGENPVAEIADRVRGPVGTDVTLTLRDPDGEERDVELTRAKIDLRPSVEFRKIEGSIGYLRVPALTQQLVAEASKALPQLLSTRYLILDLRNVASGGIEPMVQLGQWFLGSAGMGGFVSREGGMALPYREEAVAAYQRPMAILVNSMTYGVGEMLAYVLNAYKRGRLVGTKTQGGFHLGQDVELPSGGSLHVTVGLYVGPQNEIMPINGLEPDNTVEIPDLATVRSGRDVYIEAAVEVLRNNPRLE